METSKMKNMVVLKNLPSNVIEEAIIIFKETQKIKEKELIDKSPNNKKKLSDKNKSKELIISEAEMVVNNYIKEIENNSIRKSNKKCKDKSIKIYSLIMTILFFISLTINFI